MCGRRWSRGRHLLHTTILEKTSPDKELLTSGDGALLFESSRTSTSIADALRALQQSKTNGGQNAGMNQGLFGSNGVYGSEQEQQETDVGGGGGIKLARHLLPLAGAHIRCFVEREGEFFPDGPLDSGNSVDRLDHFATRGTPARC